MPPSGMIATATAWVPGVIETWNGDPGVTVTVARVPGVTVAVAVCPEIVAVAVACTPGTAVATGKVPAVAVRVAAAGVGVPLVMAFPRVGTMLETGDDWSGGAIVGVGVEATIKVAEMV